MSKERMELPTSAVAATTAGATVLAYRPAGAVAPPQEIDRARRTAVALAVATTGIILLAVFFAVVFIDEARAAALGAR
jgi:hypothetical protein